MSLFISLVSVDPTSLNYHLTRETNVYSQTPNVPSHQNAPAMRTSALTAPPAGYRQVARNVIAEVISFNF